MTGQLIQRGESTWLVRVFLGRDPETGKRKYHNKTIRGNKKVAQKYLNATLRERDLNSFVEPSSITLNVYLDQWLKTAVKPRLRENTYTEYKGPLKRYVRPALGNL